MKLADVLTRMLAGVVPVLATADDEEAASAAMVEGTPEGKALAALVDAAVAWKRAQTPPGKVYRGGSTDEFSADMEREIAAEDVLDKVVDAYLALEDTA